MRSADRVAACLLLVLSLFVMVQARELPYHVGTTAGPGFAPLWLGALLAALSLALLLRTFRAAPDQAWLPDRRSLVRLVVVIALAASAAALMLVVGFALAAGVFVAATLTFLRPHRRVANALVAVMTPLVMWLLFARWLAVPLPAFPLGF